VKRIRRGLLPWQGEPDRLRTKSPSRSTKPNTRSFARQKDRRFPGQRLGLVGAGSLPRYVARESISTGLAGNTATAQQNSGLRRGSWGGAAPGGGSILQSAARSTSRPRGHSPSREAAVAALLLSNLHKPGMTTQVHGASPVAPQLSASQFAAIKDGILRQRPEAAAVASSGKNRAALCLRACSGCRTFS